MAGHKKKRGDDHGDHPDERWLVTYADLMTLLVALFMVLFSISSVNKSKFESVQKSLQDAFSGKILPGGKSIKDAGGTANIVNPSPSAPESNLQPYVGGRTPEATKKIGKAAKAAKAAEQAQFQALKKKLDAAAAAKGLSSKIKTEVTDRGLLIRLLTDDLLFGSGSATPRPGSLPLLKQVAALLNAQAGHELIVSGHTDTQPIHSGQFQDNLALSTARAESIFRAFQTDGISPQRMTAAGRGAYQPITSNATAAGRSINRRVEILVPRVVSTTSTSSTSTPSADGSSPKIPSIKPDFASHATPG
jgi:chemotaxis protein MotB